MGGSPKPLTCSLARQSESRCWPVYARRSSHRYKHHPKPHPIHKRRYLLHSAIFDASAVASFVIGQMHADVGDTYVVANDAIADMGPGNATGLFNPGNPGHDPGVGTNSDGTSEMRVVDSVDAEPLGNLHHVPISADATLATKGQNLFVGQPELGVCCRREHAPRFHAVPLCFSQRAGISSLVLTSNSWSLIAVSRPSTSY